MSHALLKTNLKLKDDVDVARDDAPLFTSNAKTSCSMRKTNAIRTHARTHFSHGDSNQRACLSLCVHFYQQTIDRTINKASQTTHYFGQKKLAKQRHARA